MQNDQKLRQIRITLFKMVTFPSLLSQQHLSMALFYVQFPFFFIRREFDIFASYGSTF